MILSRIKELRKNNKLTQRQIAEKLNIPQRTYSHYENGTRTIPLEFIINIAMIYNVTSDYILELSDKNELDYIKTYIGKEVKVLFEEKSGEYYKGHTANYIMVNVKSDKDLSGELLNVKISDVLGLELVGNVK